MTAKVLGCLLRACAGLAAVLTAASTPVAAAEPAREFLEALRTNEYFEEALDYLDHMATSPLASESFREVMAYERGLTLLLCSQQQRDWALREKQLEDSQAALDRFIVGSPSHPLVVSAMNELGNVLAEKARLKLARSKRPGERQAAKLRAESTDLYDKSHQHFAKMANDLKANLQQFPRVMDARRDAKRYEQLESLRAGYLTTLLLSAAVLEEKADSLAPGSKEFNETLAAAGDEYGEISAKYRQRLAGLYARMYQGRTFQKIGKLQEALDRYADLLEYPDEPQEFHELRTAVLLLAAKCWMDDSQKKYAEVIDKCGLWIDKAPPTKMRSRKMPEFRMLVAKASHASAVMLRQDNPQDPRVGELLVDAREQARRVAQFPGEFQDEAQQLLRKLDGPAAASGDRGTAGFRGEMCSRSRVAARCRLIRRATARWR